MNETQIEKLNNMLMSADSFYKASSKCIDIIKVPDENRYEAVPVLIVPFIVNLSFACEIYLKILIFNRTQKIVKGHCLDELFLKLPQKEQNDIKINININKNSNFDKELKNIKNIFTEFRYSYEFDNLKYNISFLRDFAIILNNECLIIKKNIK